MKKAALDSSFTAFVLYLNPQTVRYMDMFVSPCFMYHYGMESQKRCHRTHFQQDTFLKDYYYYF